MIDQNRIWVSDHAGTRFVERVVAPYDLGQKGYLKSRSFVYRFIKKLAQRAIEEGRYDERKKVFITDWPGKENIPEIALVLQNDRGVVVVKTCWPLDEFQEEYGGEDF
jgi:hypothetical protein